MLKTFSFKISGSAQSKVVFRIEDVFGDCDFLSKL